MEFYVPCFGVLSLLFQLTAESTTQQTATVPAAKWTNVLKMKNCFRQGAPGQAGTPPPAAPPTTTPRPTGRRRRHHRSRRRRRRGLVLKNISIAPAAEQRATPQTDARSTRSRMGRLVFALGAIGTSSLFVVKQTTLWQRQFPADGSAITC